MLPKVKRRQVRRHGAVAAERIAASLEGLWEKK
jgi:hypothetical protein